jgi:deferrochelatase/peroxidase EfeB
VPWELTEGAANPGEADFALQLTGLSEAAVNRTAVEIWKVLVHERLPFEPGASISGFQRADGRGWLEFLDGVSNIDAASRLYALAAPPDPEWMGGGTYMAYLRFAVNLRVWRELPRGQQELIVGRDKLNGATSGGEERCGWRRPDRGGTYG